MIQSMAGTPQPAVFARWVADFGNFTAAHGFAVNLVVVVALAAIGAGLLSGQPRLLRPAITVLAVLCLADWVLIEDFGFFGGLGTDPNSMIPILLVVVTGYLALTRVAATATAAVPATAASTMTGPAVTGDTAAGTATAGSPPAGPGWRARLQPTGLARSFGSVSTRAVLAAWAVVMIIVGVAPAALAQANPNADPIIARAIAGNSAPLNFAAPPFQLTDQNGRQVSLASLRGKVVLLTFLDPVCTSDCPLIAQEFRAANQLLGAKSSRVELVAIVANPVYSAVSYTQAFDRQELLTSLPNWRFLTGSLPQLEQAWRNYSVAAEVVPSGGMIGHNDVAYVIDANGRTRAELNFDPGPGTTSSVSSFAVELASAAQQVMKSS